MPQFTLGIEEEFQVIDPVTRELRSHMQQIVEGGTILLKEQIKAEMHQSMVEVGTNICNNIDEARREVTFLRRVIADLADRSNLKIAAAGTHPSVYGKTKPSLTTLATKQLWKKCRMLLALTLFLVYTFTLVFQAGKKVCKS